MSLVNHKKGRMSEYDPKYCDQVIDAMKLGAGKVECAAEIGIARSTFYTWMKTYPEFNAAVEEGLTYSEAWWMKEGRFNLDNPKFNYTGWYMNMKNRWKWRDKHEISGDKDNPLNIGGKWVIEVIEANAKDTDSEKA